MSKNKTPKPQYPFRSKASIVAQINTDTGFALQCLSIMHDRQTSAEQDKKTTINKNKRGFMSSHAVTGSTLAVKVKSGEGLTAEETEKAVAIASRYGKQLAEHFRAEQIRANPELNAVAAMFSANVEIEGDEPAEETEA